jgi:uncharacterized SAM-binding protein YcdF (DUF218 family)
MAVIARIAAAVRIRTLGIVRTSEMGSSQIDTTDRPSARHSSFPLLISAALILFAHLLEPASRPIGNLLAEPLEQRFTRAGASAFGGLNGIIVLTGGDKRLAEAGRLGRENPNLKIVISGAKGMSGVAAELGGGVDLSRVLLETRSSNTYENALYSAQMIKPARSDRWLLLTTASHMPRAIGSFRRAGFAVEPWPVYDLALSGAPLTDVALHEWLGLFAYWALGRTSAVFPI